jgi:hypothetical protein
MTKKNIALTLLPENRVFKMRILLLLIVVCFLCNASGQMVYMKVSNYDGDKASFVMLDLGTSKTTEANLDFSFLKGQWIDFMTKWGVGSDRMIYWTNSESIYMFNPVTGVNKKIVSELFFILEFVVINRSAYVVYNAAKEQDKNENRYASSGTKLIKIDLNTLKKEEVPLPGGLNITNLSISKNEHFLSFIHTINVSDESRTKYFLKYYDVAGKKIRNVDSAVYSNMQWFGSSQKENSALWENDTLIYYKHLQKNTYGALYRFDLKTATTEKIVNEIPERDYTWFGYFNRSFLFSGRHSLYSVDSSNLKRILWEAPKRGIYSAVILN